MCESTSTIKPILNRLQIYFVEDMGIELFPDEPKIVKSTSIDLHAYSVLINMHGGISGGFILTVEKELGKKLLEIFSEVEIEPENLDEFIGETLAESLNIIIGNSYHLIPCKGGKIKFSPPLGLSKTKAIENYKEASVVAGEFSSSFGYAKLIYIDYNETNS
ncbi:MAG: chemotaxis protein CheX [Sulfurospirillaceae bacterium]|jgi:CheY-specific phosphatase CheX|nr:chemotaxis protein CheX [Sulfurospirillaceae bacterium]MCK9546198.1 chemotaxis protein CheX [Sulfurospirillaceae bacterium]MDY0238269.1 chemotaxis protein CheX [Campylobacterales bacterium]NLM99306.1 chemotaxis protein CheX [Campylobacteraceae bacterium]